MIKQIVGEQPFSMLNNGFSVSPSSEGYSLQYSGDGINYRDWDDEIPANETLIVTGLPFVPLYFRLKGNNSTVTVNY